MDDDDILQDPRLFDAVISALPSGLIVTDERGVVRLANRAARAMLARETDEPVGTSLVGIRGELEAMLWPTDRGEVLLLPTPGQADMGFHEPRVLGFTSRDLTDEGGERTGTVVVLSDITDELSRKRKTAHRRRLADVGAVVASVAHEIRNPVFAITSLTQLLQQDAGVKELPEGDLMLSKIMDETRRISRLVDDLLGFSRDRELVLEKLDLVALLDTLLEDLRLSLAHGDPYQSAVPLKLEANPRTGGRVEWRVDKESVRQVVSNLVRNAVQAVRARTDQGEEHDVTVRIDYWDDWVELEVEDKGIGIDNDVLPHVFDAFFTSNKKGTGLGLAVVDRLVRQHRGTISVGSKSGSGTTVTVRFPP